jgi:hypothetical protein
MNLEKTVHEALAVKANTETITGLWNQMENIENAVEAMENARSYDATNPSAKTRPVMTQRTQVPRRAQL